MSASATGDAARPAPVVAATPAESAAFRTQYMTQVSALKHTTKKDIVALTEIAYENRGKHAADVVSVLLKRFDALQKGEHCIPLLYLIDSICQNLGRKGADYPKRLQPHMPRMIQQTLTHCSLKHKGSLYRMWNTWKKNHTFNKEYVLQMESLLNAVLSEQERADALARPSAAAPLDVPDARKRAHNSAASSPSASPAHSDAPSASPPHDGPAMKRARVADPRGPSVAEWPMASMSAEGVQLSTVLDNLMLEKPALQAIIAGMQTELRQRVPPHEAVQLVATLATRLQTIITKMEADAAAAARPVLPVPAPVAPLQPPVPFPMPPMPLHHAGSLPPPPVQPLPVPSVRPVPPAQPVRVETARPLTFSEADLKSRHGWVPASLYGGIPLSCKTCGRRMQTPAMMTAHLDWHFKMARRQALIAKAGGVRSQGWYWSEAEWIAADDVIFGVQQRGKAGAQGGKSAAEAAAAEAAKRAVLSVTADDKQPLCAMCHEEFKRVWSGEDEEWMYRGCLRIDAQMLTEARANLAQLEAAKPAPVAAEVGGAQAAALATKEEERVLAAWRASKVEAHLRTFQGKLLHQECHFGLLSSIEKSKLPPPAPSPREGSPAPDSAQPAKSQAATDSSLVPPPVTSTLSQPTTKLETKLELAATLVKSEPDSTKPQITVTAAPAAAPAAPSAAVGAAKPAPAAVPTAVTAASAPVPAASPSPDPGLAPLPALEPATAAAPASAMDEGEEEDDDDDDDDGGLQLILDSTPSKPKQPRTPLGSAEQAWNPASR